MKELDANLTGKLLIATPGMDDPRFVKSVIYMCSHSDDGGMGLIVNKPQADLLFSDLLDQMGVNKAAGVRDIRVHFGGPVDQTRGFVLHSNDYAAAIGTLKVTDEISMSATLDVIEDIASGAGPDTSMLALGYAGWAPGQLESEIAHNGWLTCDARSDIVFGRANEHKWAGALKHMGIDPLLLSDTAGRA
ncbi:YqgE/AlgH family protein [Yoonia sp. I 8.24]|uniref:YqgE/AlgH family protein n=1 Tax=Yoonia sp. I 8.24 TaxID=1537229 RepID=UPI001EDD287B|nr:YqgE/AlgH family protein [Yoonia sp. I 8.24]MCG3269347.1 YqgE/AlgH family protein [Yoonia sp. I 8.24]